MPMHEPGMPMRPVMSVDPEATLDGIPPTVEPRPGKAPSPLSHSTFGLDPSDVPHRPRGLDPPLEPPGFFTPPPMPVDTPVVPTQVPYATAPLP